MSHNRRNKSHAVLAERGRRFKTLQAELMEAGELPNTVANRLRVEAAALIDLATDNVRQALLRGELVEAGALERLAAARSSILPPVQPTFSVRFVDHSDVCIKCRELLPPPEERQPVAKPVDASTIAPVDNAPASPTDAPAATPAPATNVMPLRQPPSIHGLPNAPLKHDEPWRLTIASELRRFDIPENF